MKVFNIDPTLIVFEFIITRGSSFSEIPWKSFLVALDFIKFKI